MKKLMNQPESIVHEMLEGFEAAHPQVVYHRDCAVVSRREKREKVGLVSGGGSGHEPAHAGYVGRGMLDCAVAGNVFASPGPDGILRGIELASAGKGVLLIVKNYSGDVMNFEMAREFAEADGIRVETVVVRDDVAVPDSTYSTGRRGIAGTVFIHKVAGAKAEEGAPLDAVKEVAQRALTGLRSMGMAISSCTLPGAGKAGFALDEGEMEIGMGIHGEPGVRREPLKTADEIADTLLERIFCDYDYAGREVAAMVNGLGGTPLMELYVVARRVREILSARGVALHRMLVGNFMTSLDMQGCSVTLMALDGELKRLLDAPCDAPGFPARWEG